MIKNHISQINSSINTKLFGTTPDNKEVHCYTLTNKNGMECSVINYGATITAIKIPTANGQKIDVVLGTMDFQNENRHLLEEQYPLRFLTVSTGTTLEEGIHYTASTVSAPSRLPSCAVCGQPAAIT